ncbi:MAG: hypothetical protein WA891_05025 [Acidobacteriaceae bacterium]
MADSIREQRVEAGIAVQRFQIGIGGHAGDDPASVQAPSAPEPSASCRRPSLAV